MRQRAWRGRARRAGGRLLAAAGALGAVIASAQLVAAGVIWTSQDRYIQYGAHQTPTSIGVQQGFQEVQPPKVTASGFAPFTASLGGAYPAQGASQTSSIGTTTLDAVGYAYGAGTSSGLVYTTEQVGVSRCVVVFTLSDPTDFTLTCNPTDAPAWPVFLTGPGSTPTNYVPDIGTPHVYTGTLAAGQWTFSAVLSTGGAGGSPRAFDAHLALAPEPSAAALTSAVGLALLRRRARRER